MHPRLIQRVDSVTSVRDPEQLQVLEDILGSVDPVALTPAERAAIFRLFENFPGEDAFGIFSSFIHVLEASSGYETELFHSVRCNATEFNLEMVARIMRSGVKHLQGTDLAGLLRVARDRAPSPCSREYAASAMASLEITE